MSTEIDKVSEGSVEDGPKNDEIEDEDASVKKIPWYKFDNVAMSRGYCTVCNNSNHFRHLNKILMQFC
jgi:hypothetical protein